ncbi:MAG TPA: tetratricopeptide repeat protein [Gemmatimonadaceae bacterium]|nr:tetratricopeptide repeat protein [Gemmatimonadaceae bacterium]
MKARPDFTSAAGTALTIAAMVLAAMPVQAQRAPTPPPRVMVAIFQSTEPGVGVQFADALRARLGRDGNVRDLTVIPKADIENTLRASGYPIDQALGPNDAKALASLIRAKDYIDGTVTRTAAGYRVDARLVLARDNTVAQAMPAAEAARLDQAAQAVSRSYLQARRQIEHEERCYNALRAGNVEEAITQANAGLRQHPDANMVRVCLANAYVTRDTPKDGVSVVSATTLQLVEQVLATDSRNIQALRLAALGYKAANNEDKYVETLTGLLAAAPHDLTLQQQVVNELAASGRASLAAPIIKEALSRSSGDPSMLRTAWLVLLAARDFEAAIPVGRDLIVADTAQATANFYSRLAGALSGLNRNPEAVTVLNTATQRFPSDASLWVALAEAHRKSGNMEAARQAAQRALAADPSAAEPYVILATIYGDANPDSVYAVLSRAPSGGNSALIAQLALAQGNNAYRAGNTSRNRADFQRAVRFLELSNRLSPSNAAQFLLGASAFSIGQSATTDASTSRSCELARLAQSSFATARANVPAGREEFPEPTSQLMAALPQFETPVAQMVRQFCR